MLDFLMNIRLFQWLVPLIVTLFIANQFLRYNRGRLNLGELIFGIFVWSAIGVLALFPDQISNFIAALFGIKSNTNAVLFFGLGILFYFQYRLYRIQVSHRREITKLTRILALHNYEKKEAEK